MKNRIGIFGGSFDPVHLGHISLAESFLCSGLIDELLVLPAPDPPHKESSIQASFKERLKMLKLAFQGVQNVTISGLEKNLPSPSYTLQTVAHLQEACSDVIFFLCIGEDSLVTLHTWYKYKDLLQKVSLLVAERPGYDSSDVGRDILEAAIFVDHKPEDVSSTSVKKLIYDDIGAAEEHLPKSVAKYINRKQLYR